MLYIDMSTIAPSTSRKVYGIMKAKGVESLDAPVSGGEVGAKEATLSIMVGGTKEAFQRALPIFQIMGKNIVHMGEPGAGQVTKACNQIVVGVTMQAVAEALTLARKAGVDPAKVREALLGGFAQSRILDLHGKRMLDRNFQPGFKIKLHRKDLNIALQTGRELSVPLFTTSQVAELMNALLAAGKGDLDHSSLGMLAEQLSGGRVNKGHLNYVREKQDGIGKCCGSRRPEGKADSATIMRHIPLRGSGEDVLNPSNHAFPVPAALSETHWPS